MESWNLSAQVTAPEVGGGSAFPKAKIHIPMEEGSAVFWYGTLSSGELDRQSYHGGCPVIYGDKRSKAYDDIFKWALILYWR